MPNPLMSLSLLARGSMRGWRKSCQKGDQSNHHSNARELFEKKIDLRRKQMKKFVWSVAACTLLMPGFAAAKDQTLSGEIMDSQCAKNASHPMMLRKEGQ